MVRTIRRGIVLEVCRDESTTPRRARTSQHTDSSERVTICVPEAAIIITNIIHDMTHDVIYTSLGIPISRRRPGTRDLDA